jgi:hypothetical protein
MDLAGPASLGRVDNLARPTDGIRRFWPAKALSCPILFTSTAIISFIFGFRFWGALLTDLRYPEVPDTPGPGMRHREIRE